MKTTMIEMGNENLALKKHIEAVKQRRKVDLEESLSLEECAENEIALLKTNIEEMSKNETSIKQELEAQYKIVSVLRDDIDDLILRTRKQEAELKILRNKRAENLKFEIPKKTIKQNNYPLAYTSIQTENRFLSLSVSQSESTNGGEQGSSPIVLKAQVHRADTDTPRTHSVAKKTLKPMIKSKGKKKVVVLADSHGRNLSYYLQDLYKDYEVCVHTKPGAKLKYIIKEGGNFIEKLTNEDYLVVVAGTNDMNLGEPGQLTVGQGVDDLLSYNINTNVIIVSIPYRYDIPRLNDKIFFVNKNMEKKTRLYKGKLNLIYEDINLSLQRSSYTGHGLHLNKRGKRLLGRTMSHGIQKISHSQQHVTIDNQNISPAVSNQWTGDLQCQAVLWQHHSTEGKEIHVMDPQGLQADNVDAIIPHHTNDDTVEVLPLETMQSLDETVWLNNSVFSLENFPPLPLTLPNTSRLNGTPLPSMPSSTSTTPTQSTAGISMECIAEAFAHSRHAMTESPPQADIPVMELSDAETENSCFLGFPSPATITN